MQSFKYEQQAKRNEPMPDGLNFVEQLVYQSIALLTSRYRLGQLDAEQAKREMLQIKKQYEKNADRDKYIEHCAQLWIDIELTACAFNKDETIENARQMRDVIYGQKRFAEEERNKLLLEMT